MRKAKRKSPIEVTRKRLEERISNCRKAAERARAGGAAGIARDFELQAKCSERELCALSRKPNQPIETPAGIVSVGDRIRVKAVSIMGAIGAECPGRAPDHYRLNISVRGKLFSVESIPGVSQGDQLVEVRVVEICQDGQILTDTRLKGGPLGPMGIMIGPETVEEIVES